MTPMVIICPVLAALSAEALSSGNGGNAWLSYFLPLGTSAHGARDKPVPSHPVRHATLRRSAGVGHIARSVSDRRAQNSAEPDMTAVSCAIPPHHIQDSTACRSMRGSM